MAADEARGVYVLSRGVVIWLWRIRVDVAYRISVHV